jgi:hypothetical protein
MCEARRLMDLVVASPYRAPLVVGDIFVMILQMSVSQMSVSK